MQSAKKSTKILSALSMAAAAAVASKATSAHGATLTLYYGQDSSYSAANSPNGIFTGTGFSRGTVPGSLTGTVAAVPTSISQPTTITIPVGGYLSLAIDAVLTGNVNPYGGLSTGQGGVVQPSYLGLNELGIAISSSDSTGVLLTPLSALKAGKPDSTINGIPSYASTAVINLTHAGNSGTADTPTPAWPSKTGSFEVQPALTGYDTAPASNGGLGFDKTVGVAAFAAGGNTGPVLGNNSGNVPLLKQFSTQTNTAAYSNATDFLDNTILFAQASGTVTLAPFAVPGSTEYWTATPGEISGTSGSPISYNATHFGSGDVINSLPVLVIQIGSSAPPVGHPIALFSAASGGVNSNYAPQIATLTVTGANGSYTVAQVTGLNGGAGDTKGSVEAKTFTPSTDEEIFALDVLVNGTQATAGQLAVLVGDINSGDAGAGIPASTGLTATTVSPVPNPFGSQYNLFLDPSGFSDSLLGLDLTADPNLAGYSFSAVAVVPEPMTLGLLALGGVGLMTRRHRRKA